MDREVTRNLWPMAGAVLAVLFAVAPSGCEEEQPPPPIKLHLSFSRVRMNIAQDQTSVVNVAVSGKEEGRLVAVIKRNDPTAQEDSLVIVRGGNERYEQPLTLLTDLTFSDGRQELELGCVGEGTGVLEVSVWDGGTRLDVTSQMFDCYHTDPDDFTLGLKVKPSRQRGGLDVELTATALDDDGEPIPDVSLKFSATGVNFKGVGGNDPVPGQKVEITRTTSPEGNVAVRITCPEDNMIVPVSVEYAEERYGKVPPAIATGVFSCYVQEGDAEILLQAERGEVEADGEDRVRVVMVVVDDLGVQQPNVQVTVSSLGVGYMDLDRLYTGPSVPVFLDQEHKLLQIYTDEDGKASFQFVGGEESGTGYLTAETDIQPAGANASQHIEGSLRLDVVGLGAINFIGAQPPILGVKGYGFNELSKLTFKVTDSRGQPFPAGTPVTFSIPHPVRGVSLEPHVALTNDEGECSTLLRSGTEAAPVSVRAEVSLSDTAKLQVDSPAIPIVGVYPSTRGMSLSCERKNVPALIDADQVNSYMDIEVPCTVRLQDRFGNPVGLATTVSFRAEAGSIVGAIDTVGLQPDTPTTASTELGLGTTIFSTFGVLPQDVDPIDGVPDRDPAKAIPREPRWRSPSGRTVNPRDGLVTIIAYTQGEEWYLDVNDNGQYDPGEPFEDMSEPFVDANDNGQRDPGETFIDVAMSGVEGPNGRWDPPNGQWDRVTVIWTEARVLYSGLYDRSSPETGWQIPEPVEVGGEEWGFRLQKLQTTDLLFVARDSNGNLLSADTNYMLKSVGAVELMNLRTDPMSLPDSLGMDWRLETDCSGLICQRKGVFHDFGLFADSPTRSGYDMHVWLKAEAEPFSCCCGVASGTGDHFQSILPDEDQDLPQCSIQAEGAAPREEGDDSPPRSICEGTEEDPLFRPVFVPSRLTMEVVESSQDGQTRYSTLEHLTGLGCGNLVFSDNRSFDERLTVCVTGEVITPDGAPVPGATVVVSQRNESMEWPPFAGNDGSFCSPSPRGWVDIVAFSEGDEDRGLPPCRSEAVHIEIDAPDGASCAAAPGRCLALPQPLTCVPEEGGGQGDHQGDPVPNCYDRCMQKITQGCGAQGDANVRQACTALCHVAEEDMVVCLEAAACEDLAICLMNGDCLQGLQNGELCGGGAGGGE